MEAIIVTIVAVALTLTSATMTILGYTSLYSQNSLIISSLFIVLECAKATIFGVILVNGKVHHKLVLTTLAAFLIVASFIGHLSYLSKSYHTNQVAIQGNTEINDSLRSSSSSQIQGIDAQIEILNKEIQAGNEEIAQIRQRAKDLNKALDRNWVLQSNSKNVQSILEHNRQLSQEIQKLYEQRSSIQQDFNRQLQVITANTNDIANRSVFKYTADIFNIEQNLLANIINILLSLVIDTLALVLLWVAGDMWSSTFKHKHKRIKKFTEKQFTPDKPSNNVKPLTPEKSSTEKPLISESKPSTEKPFTKAKNNITIDNARNYNFEGYTVDDVVSMSENDIEDIRKLVKSEDQLNWLNSALTIRNHADVRGKLNKDVLQYSELK